MGKKNIALIWGSGAVYNSWLPIFNCLKPQHFKKDLSIDGANSALASLVYNLRFHSNNSNYADDTIYKKCQEILINTRNSICRNIQYYQETGKITVQKEFNMIVEKMVVPDCKRLLLLTTNWDMVVDEALKNNPGLNRFFRSEQFCTHLHGSYHHPDMLYLPTEVVHEQYRSQEQEVHIGTLHAQTMQNLSTAQILIIYGLSISALDAELLQVLSSSMHIDENLEVVKIIDPKHECIAEKINIMLKYPTKVKVLGFHHEELDSPINYSLD